MKDLEGENLQLQKQLDEEKRITESSSAAPGDQEVQDKASFADVHVPL